MKKIDLLYFDAGGGHRSAANALKEVIERQSRPWRVELVNLQVAMDELAAHEARLEKLRKKAGKCVWDQYAPAEEPDEMALA